ncbi:MAG TPA: 2-C-methyl-D-erythritol 4-phosphate cytidylyltransferase [Candidatus Dormibacteraeota bacterium]|nr:2-C-methyl-D-erythritol 4-phosphate cytidylyltransferase [Candidatus Dormibacteraeota bacterium]
MVVAAGRGVRFGGKTAKQYQLIGGVPMVLRALRPFTSHPDVAQVVLVLPAEDAARPPSFLSAFSALSVVAGGAHRGDSVRAGLSALRSECAVVLVHDGARPFVDRSVIEAVIAFARAGEGAVPAVPLSDTIKEASAADATLIKCTHPRARLWRAQTPQGFPRAVLEEAHARAARDGHRATDDAALVEAIGVPVHLVPDSSRNLKVTTPEDLALAELLAEASP